MYGLNEDVDLEFLDGRELIQLCVGVHQLIFNFDELVTISVEGKFSYFDSDHEAVLQPTPQTSTSIARTAALLGSSIKKYTSAADGTLILEFSNQHRLTLFDSDPRFEAYTIKSPGRTIVV
ncbi:MAG TPA: DUF6188 family protein [Terracidiphilus sp.]|nr:DUF6188 family protein [Terracidiphilus sp.]